MYKTLILLSCLIPGLALAQNSPPVVDAGPDQTILLGNRALLNGTATDVDNQPIAAWQWSVDSAPAGSTPEFFYSHMPDPPFRSDVAGDYVLSLIASDGLDWSAPDFVTIHIHEVLPPEAVLNVDVAQGPAPLTVQFDGTESFVDLYAGTLGFGWNLGDGTFSAAPTPSHTYQSPGVYLATLTVFDERGQWDEDWVEITVTGFNQPPVADAGPDREALVGQAVGFDGTGSYDPDGDDLSYAWDFDDGSPAEAGVLVSHAYETAGTYTVTLTVEDGWGGIGTDTAVVTILSPAEFTEDLIAAIESWGLPASIERLFIQPLSSIADLLAKARERAAAGRLTGFMHLCESQRGKKLTEEQADALIEGAERLLGAIDN